MSYHITKSKLLLANQFLNCCGEYEITLSSKYPSNYFGGCAVDSSCLSGGAVAGIVIAVIIVVAVAVVSVMSLVLVLRRRELGRPSGDKDAVNA